MNLVSEAVQVIAYILCKYCFYNHILFNTALMHVFWLLGLCENVTL